MTLKTKREYVSILKERYEKTESKLEKGGIIDEYLTNTSTTNRKSAIRSLNRKAYKHRKPKPGPKTKYTFDLIKPLKIIWIVSGRSGSKNLQPEIPILLNNLKKFKEITLINGQEELLLSMSTFTIDRLLKGTKQKGKQIALSRTKKSPLLKQLIPIRTNFDKDVKTGNLEIDCVLHCGGSLSGTFAETLTMVDIPTLWTTRRIFLKKHKTKVIAALHDARKSGFPFPVLSIDFDNGPEFVNWALHAYCKREGLDFTRARSYHSNDQAHVEERNRRMVRDIIGHDRIENQDIVDLIADLYENELHLLSNFFWPVRKLISKEKKGGRYYKKYDKAKTPYRRVIECKTVDKHIKLKLANEYSKLNVMELTRSLESKLKVIQDLISVTGNNLATDVEK